MKTMHIINAIQERFMGHEFSPVKMPVAEVVISVPPDLLRPVVAMLVETGECDHLSTITGQDTGDEIQLLYHFWSAGGLTLRVTLPRDRGRVPSISDLIPTADFYEREIIEMLGVEIDGHRDPKALLLPDDWQGEPPLRMKTKDEER